jgi:imidazole glycerol-phosphate synthase subunit HisF
MLRFRVIPSLLIDKGRLVKTSRFTKPTYIGDLINAVKIFNQKDVDEIVVLDITASSRKAQPDFELIRHFAEECFMPAAYGGGIQNLEQARKILRMGIEKVIFNTAVTENPDLITQAAKEFGSQSVLVSVDVKKPLFGQKKSMYLRGSRETGLSPVEMALRAEELGAGEIILNSVDRDGMMQGMDLELIQMVSSAVNVPLVAMGGVGSLDHMRQAKDAGASGVAAGAFFVFQGPHRGVLISYPDYEQLLEVLS